VRQQRSSRFAVLDFAADKCRALPRGRSGTGVALKQHREERSRGVLKSVWVRERSVGKETQMCRRVLKSMVLTSLAALIAIPAFAQVRADLGPLHIRIATDAPPRAQYERRMPRPHRDAVWIRGYWDRQDDRWAWVSGRWEQPSDRRARWINARYTREGCAWYRRRGCAWRYEPAHWSDQQVVEGEDYQRWRNEHRSDRGRRHN